MRFRSSACALTLGAVLSCAWSASAAEQTSDASQLEAKAVRQMAEGADPFPPMASLSDQLGQAIGNAEAAEAGGRLALLWVRAMRAAVARIPMDGRDQSPYREFLARHATDVVYSEPAGEWLLQIDTIWTLHDRYRASSSAEAIAWEAASSTLPGECEGYPPCDLAQLDLLDGEYLRRYPDGEHAAEVARRVGVGCDEIQRLLDSPGGQEFFNPVTDCVDLTPKGQALADALARAHVDASAALASLNALRARCPANP